MSRNKRLCRRRSSRSLAGFAARDLCDTIPTDLPPSERLVMFLEKSFQFAFLAAQKDVMLNEDFDIEAVRQKGADCWEEIKAAISENDIHSSAVDKDGRDSIRDTRVEECHESVKLIKAESAMWCEKLQHYRDGLISELDISETSHYKVKASEVMVDCPVYDYSDIMAETSKSEEKLLRQNEEVQSAKEAIKQSVDLYKSLNSYLKQKCAKSFHKEVETTPRTTIKGLAASSKIIRTYNGDKCFASSSSHKTDDGDANK